jgi:hypothetical protein
MALRREVAVLGSIVVALSCTRAPATATAEPTSAPIDPPAPSPTPAPRPATAIAVKGEGGVVTVTGSDGGETLWSREFKIEEETELQPWSEATLAGAVAYLQVDYHMLALNTTTGETLWTSDANGGLCKPLVFEDMVYTCSYYGEPLIGILESKTSPLWRERDFKSWFLDRGTEKDNLPFIRQEVARGHRAMLRVLKGNPAAR